MLAMGGRGGAYDPALENKSVHSNFIIVAGEKRWEQMQSGKKTQVSSFNLRVETEAGGSVMLGLKRLSVLSQENFPIKIEFSGSIIELVVIFLFLLLDSGKCLRSNYTAITPHPQLMFRVSYWDYLLHYSCHH